MSETVVKIENLSKIYKLYDKPIDRLKESLSITRKNYHKDFYALNDISFEIGKGEIVGIIGTNGSGKSTLLKILTGVLTPSSGSIEIKGKIAALLELGAGFNPEYTGIENIYLNGMVMGFSRADMDGKVDDIIAFADIGEYINQPVKSYSSGMFARLAFAVSINVDPDILIVDEALSVGDVRFQQKCYRKMEEFRRNRTVILVTHDLGAVTKFSQRVVWIEKGHLMDIGDPVTIAKQYQAYLMNSQVEKGKTPGMQEKRQESIGKKQQVQLHPITEEMENFGDKKAEITGIGFCDADTGEDMEFVMPGRNVKVIIGIENHEAIPNEIIGFSVKDRLGNMIFQTNTYVLGAEVDSRQGKSIYGFTFRMPLLNSGTYTISPAVAEGSMEEHMQHNWVFDAYIFNVIRYEAGELQGFVRLSDVTVNAI